jgi:hypothetical protein
MASPPSLFPASAPKLKAASHSCERLLSVTRPVPTCVAELAAQTQRLMRDRHPTRRAWLRTTSRRVGLSWPPGDLRRPLLVV